MQVIVVEDELKDQKSIKEIIREFSFENNCDIEIKYFKKYDESLQNEINNCSYRKVYIMDIELEHSISGIEIAKKIREKDWDSEIIFVTTHDKMFESVHRSILEVFDFIEKFQNFDERLKKDLKIIYEKKFDKKLLKLTGRNVNVEIYMKNILYITRDKEDRKVVIHTENEVEFKIGMTLTEILNMLDNRFVQTHKSCIVNKEKVVKLNYSQGYFVLETGEKVDMLSKKYRKGLEDQK